MKDIARLAVATVEGVDQCLTELGHGVSVLHVEVMAKIKSYEARVIELELQLQNALDQAKEREAARLDAVKERDEALAKLAPPTQRHPDVYPGSISALRDELSAKIDSLPLRQLMSAGGRIERLRGFIAGHMDPEGCPCSYCVGAREVLTDE